MQTTEHEANAPLTLDQLNDLRRKVLNKEEVSEEELASALRALRSHRGSALQKSAAKRAKKIPKSLDELLAV